MWAAQNSADLVKFPVSGLGKARFTLSFVQSGHGHLAASPAVVMRTCTGSSLCPRRRAPPECPPDAWTEVGVHPRRIPAGSVRAHQLAAGREISAASAQGGLCIYGPLLLSAEKRKCEIMCWHLLSGLGWGPGMNCWPGAWRPGFSWPAEPRRARSAPLCALASRCLKGAEQQWSQ